MLRRVLLSVLLPTLATAAELTRGPYLQLAAPTEITIVFRTDQVASGQVRFGERGQPLTRTVTDLIPGTEHELTLTGLTPSTRYDYEVWVDGVALAGGDSHQFRTYPTAGQSSPFRFFAWGDSGTGEVSQLAVAERLSREVDEATFSLILGDIIYYVGEPELYDARFFNPYGPLVRRQVIWPTIGNHDVGLDPLGGPYLDAFRLPANNPANSELYYSFDYGDAHFVCLDTHVNSFSSVNAPQLQWAAADLAASTAKWKFVYFHVPPYTGGTHADNPLIRDNILPVLEAAGVDVVFAGHSHVYERTYLLKGNTIQQPDRSSYVKPIPGAGTLYVVSGTAGQTGGLSNPTHPLMAFQAGNVLGVSVIDVNGDQLRGFFLREDGSSIDLFQLSKGADTDAPRLLTARSLSPTEVELVFDEPLFAGSGPGGAERATAYDLTPRALVQSATLLGDQRTVRLLTSPQSPGAWSVHATGIGDRSGNGNLASARAGWVVRRRVSLTGNEVTYSLAAQDGGWRTPNADTSTFDAGTLPLGYGVPTVATTVSPAVTLYARLALELPAPPERLHELTLELDYDDGFVASLNGVEVLRQNVPAGQSESTVASSSREAGFLQRLKLPPPTSLLRADGGNVLAIEVHNVASTSSDLYLSARVLAEVDELDAGVVDAGLPVDAGPPDAGADDAGAADAGTPDAGVPDAAVDAGPDDAGAPDASVAPGVDGGTPDAGQNFGGGGGCTCQVVEPTALFAVVLILLARRPRAARART